MRTLLQLFKRRQDIKGKVMAHLLQKDRLASSKADSTVWQLKRTYSSSSTYLRRRRRIQSWRTPHHPLKTPEGTTLFYKFRPSSFMERQPWRQSAIKPKYLSPLQPTFLNYNLLHLKFSSCIPTLSCIQFQSSLYQDKPCKFIQAFKIIFHLLLILCVLSINTLTTRLHCAPLTLSKRNHEEEVQNPLPGMRLLILFWVIV